MSFQRRQLNDFDKALSEALWPGMDPVDPDEGHERAAPAYCVFRRR